MAPTGRVGSATFARSFGALLCTAAAVLATPAQAQLQLVSQEEALASREAPERPEPRSAPQFGAPRIIVSQPDVAQPVTVPTPIRVRFEATAPAEPKPESFRVLYGTLRLDITARLLSVARVTREGIDVPQASLPRGAHTLRLLLEDSAGRTGQHTLSFNVP